jgi:hypothetical protein
MEIEHIEAKRGVLDWSDGRPTKNAISISITFIDDEEMFNEEELIKIVAEKLKNLNK